MKLNDDGNAYERNISFDEDKSPGAIVIQEFLRSMIDTPYNKTELLLLLGNIILFPPNGFILFILN